MGYLALYRRFRPTTFDKVIGQDAIVKTLTNQIKTDKIGHAYLFCGARGTGKTSLAKIFAKAVNCQSTVNGSPCGKCESCKALADSSNIDLLEMDAASNNKVENVREIRENIQYPPVSVKYKVYIIDEVHMLTTEAFNALLKTLEEPPKHAIFILATTEPNKLPATILSRCMRFDFRLIETKKLSELVSSIYDEIGKKYTTEAVTAIAKAGEGSVRDTLSVADLCVSIGEDKLTYDDVISVLGATDVTKIDELVRAIIQNDVGETLKIIDHLLNLGKSLNVLSKDVLNYLRDLLIVKTCKTAKDILALPEDKFNKLKATADLAVESRLLRIIEILSTIENSIRFSSQPRAVLESAFVKATSVECDYSFDSLLARVKTLEETLKSLQSTKVAINSTPKEVELKNPREENEKSVESQSKINHIDSVTNENEAEIEVSAPTREEITQIVAEPNYETTATINENQVSEPTFDAKRVWGTVIRKLRGMPDKTILWVACQDMTCVASGNTLIIDAGGNNELELVNKEENIALISELVKPFGDIKIQIKGKVTSSKASEKNISEFFGDTLTVK